MAKKKADAKTTAQPISFRCPTKLKEDIEDLARLSRKDVSSILIEICSAVVDANKERLTRFKQSAGQPIKMPTFATPKKKTTAAPINAAAPQDNTPLVDAANMDGDKNEN